MIIEKGCSSCPFSGKLPYLDCPDAYSKVAKYCNNYDHTTLEIENSMEKYTTDKEKSMENYEAKNKED